MNKFFKDLFLIVPIQEKILFAKNLAIMTKAGMSISNSLRMLQGQTKSKSMKTILQSLNNDVANGQFLSASLEKFRNVFGDFMINIIRVGEASGILCENLNYLADGLKKKQLLHRKVLSALIYPIVIVFTTILITGFLIIYIFPKILPIFKSMKIDLPITTKILIVVSEFFLAYSIHTIVGIIIVSIIIWLLTKIQSVRFFKQRLTLHLPFMGSIIRNYNIANFCRTLGLLLKSDIKVVEALDITSGTLTNSIYKKELKVMAQKIAKGEEISKHLEKNPQLFPIMLSQLVGIGEATGNLSDTFLYLSDFYEEKVEETTKNLSTALEPVMMLLMGGIVGFIAISIITPIYEVSQGINR